MSSYLQSAIMTFTSITSQTFNFRKKGSIMKKLTLILSFIICSLVAFAQQPQGQAKKPNRPNYEQFVQEKTNFLLRELKLSPADSTKFVPLYKEKMMAKGALMQKYRHQHFGKMEEITDDIYLKAVMNDVNRDLEDAQLEKDYVEQFKAILTPKQLFTYMMAERKFINQFFRPDMKRKPEQKAQ